ncbi:MAG: hypothetical protein A2V96_00915 [Candidatus Yonathbacteria bacterium RBG_16_43_6]|uniref:DUF5667 domain-containing protein n=2 Tax=Parcubacteria group TaxID=1794811 RepID=A0A1G2SDM4_9BACT|nr:MAG: hypothetical protein UW78_C0008G0024 [Candidatus Azambacteria bacterium GW2011_GWA1_44_9]OHA80287.1 MAG: hypothetical protein A2V96_00915 [Candidatus Yonathbacteria bacterium RBG_16_43_6]OHA82551.1 MAG: hypothetical protein A3B07_02955 [Candidatus Yonathbacteria bacterium RIFCSPLOWO2_01_FULL_43_27]
MKKIIVSGITLATFMVAGIALAQGVAVSEKKGDAISQENRANSSALEENEIKVAYSTTSSKEARSGNKKGTTTAELHRSEVANFVQTLLSSPLRVGGIGEQVRLIAQEQASSTEIMVAAIEKVEQRSRVKTFIVGADNKNLGVIRSELVTMQNRIQRLGAEAERMASSTEKDTLIREIVSLGEERMKLETFIKDNEEVFSLFGWVRKIFE